MFTGSGFWDMDIPFWRSQFNLTQWGRVRAGGHQQSQGVSRLPHMLQAQILATVLKTRSSSYLRAFALTIPLPGTLPSPSHGCFLLSLQISGAASPLPLRGLPGPRGPLGPGVLYQGTASPFLVLY